MHTADTQDRKYTFYLYAIVFAALCLRLYKLDFQSLWLDELYTMKESDPDISWIETIKAVADIEYKSPFYYLVVKLLFMIFGHTAVVARSLSVIGGVAGVYAIYFLGKELFSPRLGIIVALLTCVNPFHIYFSQEARSYIFLFLFTVTSFLFFIRTLRSLSTKNAILYGVNILITLHLHPFAFLVIAAQGIVMLIYFFSSGNSQARVTQIKKFALAYVIMILGFLPVIQSLLSTSEIKEFWIPKPAPGYFADYFYEFFGNSELLKPLLLTLLICFLVHVFISKKENGNYSGPSFNFILIGISLVVIFLVPYLYSILVIPAVVSRYVINALPLFLLMLSLGVVYVDNKFVRNSVLVVFISVSLIDLIIVKEYYKIPTKTQFRELAEYVKLNSEKPYLIINQKTPWQHSYYLKHFGIASEVISPDKEIFADSVIAGKKQDAFWILGGHGDPKLSSEKTKLLENRFIMTKSADFIGTWAQLYIPINNGNGDVYKADVRNFSSKDVANILGDSVICFWGNDFIRSKSIALPVGKYSMKIISSGTSYKNELPHLNVYLKDSLLGKYYTGASFGFSPTFSFSTIKNDSISLKIQMDNDGNDGVKEDRNAFIKAIYFIKD
jgi:mannosyltransferase